MFVPCLLQRHRPAGGTVISLGHRLLDDYLELVAARSRPNTVLASAYDLKVFFSIIGRDPVEVDTADVLAFIKVQREPRLGAEVVRIEDGESGLSARTIKRRLATVAGLYEYLIIRDDAGPQSGASGSGGAASRTASGARGTVDPRTADSSPGDRSRPGRCPHSRATDPPGPGDGRGDAAGWFASL